MKPSERIKEIMVEMAKEKGNWWLENKIGAIWEYLDEEWEKEQERIEKLDAEHEVHLEKLRKGEIF